MTDNALPRFDGHALQGLSPEMRQVFDSDGVLVLEGLVSDEACDALIQRMGSILDEFDPAAHHSVFSSLTNTQGQEQYFLDSAREIRFFFEEKARDEEGRLKADFRASLNKVGHALHDLDPEFCAFSRQTAFRNIAQGLGFEEPLLLQSMYIFKPPRIGGEVTCHQDSSYLWSEPQSCIGLWLALEDATIENGCLWGLPGMHKEARPRSRYERLEGQSGASDILLDERPWPVEECVPIEATRGTLVVLHGQFPHRSGANRSDKSREAYSLHLIDGRCDYPATNWLRWDKDNFIYGFGNEVG